MLIDLFNYINHDLIKSIAKSCTVVIVIVFWTEMEDYGVIKELAFLKEYLRWPR